MSALNLFVQGDAAYIISDTAIFESDGRVLSFASKVTAVPHARLAIMWTGCGPTDAPFLEDLGKDRVRLALKAVGVDLETASLWQILPALPKALRHMHDVNKRSIAKEGFSDWLGLGVALIDRGQPVVLFGQTDPVGHVPAYSVVRVRSYLTSGRSDQSADDYLAEGFGRPVDLTDPTSFDVRRDGASLLGLQRRMQTIRGGARQCAVGGEGQLTTVCSDGVTTETIVRWPDRVGCVPHLGG